MLRFKFFGSRHFGRFAPCVYLLWLFWLAGIALGFWVAFKNSLNMTHFMQSAVASNISFVGFFFSLFLPFVFSAFLVHIKKPLYIVFLAFFKAFIFAWSAGCIISGFGYAGWLIRQFLLFSDSCTVVILHWFWFRIFTNGYSSIKSDVILSAVSIMMILLVDYNVVTPYLMSLFK